MEYHILENDEQRGPYALSQIQSMWGNGVITSSTQYWNSDSGRWMPVRDLLESHTSSPPVINEHAPPVLSTSGLGPPVRKNSTSAIMIVVLAILILISLVALVSSIGRLGKPETAEPKKIATRGLKNQKKGESPKQSTRYWFASMPRMRATSITQQPFVWAYSFLCLDVRGKRKSCCG
jgi:hypothetical protein